ncbi:uncharacterized protein Z519_06827 [Cladophialophora bantiana CBS 173.52]|uniref:Amino-acid N-acetyltransferase subunit Mak10 n=1 Tax=Cladophialophora bantiana (strain ATCC 10958 / CBS 173.52 / CDC B-1940 / NIH 8579) TaxID=1442370 RepID=A0A0D2HIB3_CLAB1|nr:uncharacterized protein Z519_06827 [Cladophialophora bantiana CBS 173.52]KIW92978.1 hypothetical protein Z519_06827 [Cladophialophora bantiana CBS 173.52]
MVQSQIVHPNVQITEITREFCSAASKLTAGKLVKDEHFTLYEAVSALEIGDPKMDSGCSAFDADIDEEFDPARTVSAEEMIWLMDQLMYREVAWHMGYPLSQTLFTSIHIERLLWPQPKQFSDACFWRDRPNSRGAPSLLHDVFQPYCVGLIKCCDLVLSMVASQHFYEEEDFAPQIYNRPLLHDFSVREVMVSLQDARAFIQNSNLPQPLKGALKDRVDARSAFLQLFHSCELRERPTEPILEENLALIKTIEETSTLGRPTSTVMFTLKMQRGLASSVPPRPMIVIEKDKALPFFRQLLTDTTTAFQMLDITSSSDLLVAYQRFMAQTPQPAVYVRALLQSFLNVDNTVLGRFSTNHFISQDMLSLSLPSALPLDSNNSEIEDIPEDQQIELGAKVNLFLNRCGQSFLNLFRTYCLNRCRLRRSMCHAALEWDQIQAEAEDLDAFVQSVQDEQPIPYPNGEEPTFSYSFSSWVYHYKLIQLRTIHQMGFELSIYAPHEFAEMYWYLSFLSNSHLSHLERISFFVSSSRQVDAPRRDKVQIALKRLYRHFTWIKATEAMAKALHRVFTIIQRHGHLHKPSPAYASDRLRYELRMRPFLNLSIPEPIEFDVAHQSCSLQDLPDELVLEQASSLTQTARKAWEEVLRGGWESKPPRFAHPEAGPVGEGRGKTFAPIVDSEWTKDVRNSMKACIGTAIAIAALSKALQVPGNATAGKGISGLKVDIPPVGDRDRWHLAWPVPKISS